MIGNESNCSLQCAILAVSKQILRSGLEDLLVSSCADRTLPTRRLCELGVFAVHHQIDNIFQTVSNREQRANSHQCSTVAVDQWITSISDDVLLNCRVAKGQHGRMLIANRDVERGIALLRERPYVCCTVSECGCAEDGPILVEHLCIATALHYCPERNEEKLVTFKEQLFSGLQHSEGREQGGDESDTIGRWSVHTQCLMCVACAITALLHLSRDGATVDRAMLAAEAWELVQVLARIPANLHAVSEVVATARSQDRGSAVSSTVQQSRVGFGLFLTASAANHSCAPNSAIRFAHVSSGNRVVGCAALRHFTTVDVSSILASSAAKCATYLSHSKDKALARLMDTVIEVAAIASISNGHEVTVSYGPMRGTHGLTARRECLQRQYLFRCGCAGCIAEEESQADQMSTASASATHRDLPGVPTMLRRLDAAVGRLGGELSVLIDAGDVDAIARFERERLGLIDRHLQLMRSEYFPCDGGHCYSSSAAAAAVVVDARDGQPTSHRALFAHFSRAVCALADLRAHALATTGDFSRAADLVSAAIALMVSSGQHGDSDVVVGRERVKLAQLQLSAGDVSACRATATRAMRDLQPFVGPSDPDWIEVTGMLEFVKTRG